MEDKKVLNKYSGANENDFVRTYVTLEPIFSRRTETIKSIRNECRPIAYKEILNYSLQSSVNNFCLPLQDNCRDKEVSDANGLVSSLQWQNNFQEVPPNTVFEYNEFSGVNKKVQESEQGDSVDISTVGECIRIACDCLLGINPQNNELISETFDARYDHSIPSENHLFDPRAEPSITQNEHLNANGGINSENKCESVDLKNELIKVDSINSGLKFSVLYRLSNSY
ncbi:zinc finger protein 16 [Trichonephila inaurata madagascariensis]|uniref:Zinc finger protein 16 n=1 Tax=Trichonephila inaurata madagascariensis TaxID=2747483 RepID=A0A8X7BVJ3_9ARAC|nr:zinc finger protein 16 [Trichonephila inaurata madagascariensis]